MWIKHKGPEIEAFVSRAPSECIFINRVTSPYALTESIKALLVITQSEKIA